MSTTTQLNNTLSTVLETISSTLVRLEKSSDSAEKIQLASVVKTLAESQRLLVESIDIHLDDDFDFDDSDFADDFYEEEKTDEQMSALLDTKQIQFTSKDGKKKKHSKNKNKVEKLEDEDLPF